MNASAMVDPHDPATWGEAFADHPCLPPPFPIQTFEPMSRLDLWWMLPDRSIRVRYVGRVEHLGEQLAVVYFFREDGAFRRHCLPPASLERHPPKTNIEGGGS